MSTAPAGVQPKRKRGHERVAAILQTGVEVFAEKGFDAATMTEIASRSGTAIASLYRFFPSKESLADALISDYMKFALGALGDLRARAAKGMTPEELAAALVEYRLQLGSQRRFVIDLVEARGGAEERKKQFRNATLDEMAGLLQDNAPNLSRARAEVMAPVLVHVLKSISSFDVEPVPATRRALLAETRELIRIYLTAARRTESHSTAPTFRAATKSRDRSHE
jgi:AcrR family transcriptional regulator